MAGLMATKGKITRRGGGLFRCFFGASSSSAVGGGRPFLSKFWTAGRLFSGDVLGPVNRQVPSPVVERDRRDTERDRETQRDTERYRAGGRTTQQILFKPPVFFKEARNATYRPRAERKRCQSVLNDTVWISPKQIEVLYDTKEANSTPRGAPPCSVRRCLNKSTSCVRKSSVHGRRRESIRGTKRQPDSPT